MGFLTALIGLSGPLMFSISSLLVASMAAQRQTSRCELIMLLTNRMSLRRAYEQNVLLACVIVCTLRSASLFIFSIFITLLRYHLFIWSVFSPKYMYELMFMGFDAVKCCVFVLSTLYFKFHL